MQEIVTDAVAPIALGGDPEFFFQRGGQVIGSERVLKEGGKEVVSQRHGGIGLDPTPKEFNAFVLDGVQVELNPRPHYCRTNLGKEISLAFRALKAHMDLVDPTVTPSFAASITLSKEELDSLSEQSKVAGCKPSFNLYDGDAASIKVDYATELNRSAGGHIHLGFPHYKNLMENRLKLIPVLDALLALPSVLIDRDPGNAIRRLHYGRASEHRLPDYGLEYRTLSNFWLHAFPLTSFVMGQARLCVQVLGNAYHGSPSWDAPTSLLSSVDMMEVKEAINLNDLDLARRCWDQGIRPWIEQHIPTAKGGLYASNLDAFDHFAAKVQESGLSYWFKEDPLTHWCNLDINDDRGGWESFLNHDVTWSLRKHHLQPDPALLIPQP